MKQLTCEMCGSNDLVKENGVFVCQSCGCKYSVEEAKKMMIEGVVDVSGSTVKIDTSSELTNLYELARREMSQAEADGAVGLHYNKALEYYEKIILKDPNGWEAVFFKTYLSAFLAASPVMPFIPLGHVNSILSNIRTTLSLIKDHVTSREKQIEAINRIIFIINNLHEKFYAEASRIIMKTYDDLSRFEYGVIMLFELGDCIDQFFAEYDELNSVKVDLWKNAIDSTSDYKSKGWSAASLIDKVPEHYEKIQKYDSSYVLPNNVRPREKKDKSEGALGKFYAWLDKKLK